MVDSAFAPGTRTVFVVDDDPAVLRALKFALEIEGYRVRVFASAQELLDAPGLADGGCFIVDLQMPRMDGLSLIDRLRERRLRAPAILITTNPSSSVRNRASEIGVVLIEKPLLDDSLLDGVRAAFSRN